VSLNGSVTSLSLTQIQQQQRQLKGQLSLQPDGQTQQHTPQQPSSNHQQQGQRETESSAGTPAQEQQQEQQQQQQQQQKSVQWQLQPAAAAPLVKRVGFDLQADSTMNEEDGQQRFAGLSRRKQEQLHQQEA
jgi:hypothetical protein